MRDQSGLAETRSVDEFRNGIALLGRALFVGYVGEAEAGKIERNRAKSGLGKRTQVAHKHVCRATERCAMQKEHRGSRPRLDVAKFQAVDVYELVFQFDFFRRSHRKILLLKEINFDLAEVPARLSFCGKLKFFSEEAITPNRRGVNRVSGKRN